MVKDAETVGKPKWEKKTAAAAPIWKREVTSGEAEAKYAENLGRSAKTTVGPLTRGNWKAAVAATPEEEYKKGVTGKGDRWLRKFRDGISK